ncbi:Protein of unknown function [Mucilaginibacter pineti]|uniref:DUF3592 domain-containing protein n=1 Tax=Mucilaginibacter pineti TaxID=1391627 RepID=A0A1G6V3B3_9SPHI|nr:DUF3592 domain-containing protein [Mucilaginibacter pineti]SDD48110.1 Protein of unknown function [Mucilaginibacter pineti]
MNVNYDELILLTGGAFLAVLGAGKFNERRKLIKTGVKVNGVVFRIEESTDDETNSSMYYPVIRYLTEDKEWITETYKLGSRPSVYKEGDSVSVIYDPANYKHFIIDNTFTKFLAPVLFIIGVLLIASVIIYYVLHQL